MTQDNSAILLPAARVDFFVLDGGTAETARGLSADWRFARVGIDVVDGGMEKAIERYGQAASPEMIIVETNDIGDAFVAQLGQLAGLCAEGTDAIIIGPTNDVHLYRSLVNMGVRDYLVRPVPHEEFAAVIAKALVEKRGVAGSRLVSVLGPKGGMGVTALSQLLAGVAAGTLEQKTLLLDAAGGGSTLGVAYGLEPATTLAEGVRIGAEGSEDDLKRIMQQAGEGLTLMVTGGDPLLMDSPDADAVEALVARVMQKNPVVIMDLSGALPQVQKRMIGLSAHVVVATAGNLSALRNCRTLLNEIKHVRGSLKEVDLVLNMQGLAGADEVAPADIAKALDMEVAAKVPYLPKLFAAAEAQGKPVTADKAGADATGGLTALMARALNVEPPKDAAQGKTGRFMILKGIGKMKGKGGA